MVNLYVGMFLRKYTLVPQPKITLTGVKGHPEHLKGNELNGIMYGQKYDNFIKFTINYYSEFTYLVKVFLYWCLFRFKLILYRYKMLQRIIGLRQCLNIVSLETKTEKSKFPLSH